MAPSVTRESEQEQYNFPRVDLQNYKHPELRQAELKEAARGWTDWGYVEFHNHDIPESVLEEGFEASRAFFALPKEEKMKSFKDFGHLGVVPQFQSGYKGDLRTRDGVRNNKEHCHFRLWRNPGEPSAPLPGDIIENIWPEEPKNYRAAIEALHHYVSLETERILDIFSESLGLEPKYIRDRFHSKKGEGVIARPLHMHHYPKSSEEEGLNGVIAHEDGSACTIVMQADPNINGLQFLHDGEFVTVAPKKWGLIVNSGDVMQAWSNGKYKSMTHRVRNSTDGGRLSLAYFVIPTHETVIEPFPELLNEENPSRYPSFTFAQLANMKKVPDTKNIKKFDTVLKSSVREETKEDKAVA